MEGSFHSKPENPTTFELLNTNEELIIPTKIMLHNAYPNPFNPYTTISYDMSEDNFVNLTIFDLAGKNKNIVK
ncbi:hypothetical protein CM15mP5_2260 [bacterium]|nr:MAG: hypothetical protein CM15mP5_2260 [bacterium]